MVASLCWPSSRPGTPPAGCSHRSAPARPARPGRPMRAPGRNSCCVSRSSLGRLKAPPSLVARASHLGWAWGRRHSPGGAAPLRLAHAPTAVAAASFMAPVYTPTSRSAVAGQSNADACATAPRDSCASRPGAATGRPAPARTTSGRARRPACPNTRPVPRCAASRRRPPPPACRTPEPPAPLGRTTPSATAPARHQRPGTSRPAPAAGRAAPAAPAEAMPRPSARPESRPGAPTSDPLGPAHEDHDQPVGQRGRARSRSAAACSTMSGPFSGWIRPANTSTTASAGSPSRARACRRGARPEHRQVHARADRLDPPADRRRTARSAGAPPRPCWPPAGRRRR